MLVALVILAPSLAACGDGNVQARDEVLDALAATEELSRSFVHVEETAAETVEVRGLIEDDFRFTALASVDGSPTIEQVVVDDALAVRVLGDELRAELAILEGPDEETSQEGVTVGAALAARRWVLDEVGAPAVTTTADDFDNLGVDPVRDARTVLDYVERAVSTSFRVARFNPDSLDYKPSDDPFEAPEEGSEVIRYDVVPRFLPRAADAGGGGGTATQPGVANLRKMAVFVEGGKVIRVVERIAAEGDIGDRLEDYLRVITRGADEAQAAQLDAALESLADEERGPFLIEVLNVALTQLGEDPVRPRDMSVDFVDLGGGQRAELPPDAIEGSLDLLLPPEEDEAETGDDLTGGAQAPPPTAVPDGSGTAGVTPPPTTAAPAP